jgi:amino-acid N-acetyltransferase
MTARAVLTMTGPARPGLMGGVLRAATAADAPAIHALIDRYQAAGRLLPRSVEEIARHADRFLVVQAEGAALGCAELAPLSASIAEVRSLVVDEAARGLGFGRQLVDTLADEAHLAGFRTICAFTHEPGYFVRLGYSLVPHAWLPQKIALDCAGCSLFRACGQDAVRLHLGERPRGARA